MKLEDFEIGKIFFASAGYEWLCTDKGQRTITAIMLEPDKDKSWFKGPPFNIDEKVFDEYDMTKCYSDTDNLIYERLGESHHPHFTTEDTFKMIRANKHGYTRKNILKRDRVSKEGLILHPYAAEKKDDAWHINLFEIFSRTYSTMHEDLFVKLEYSSEQAMKSRATQFKKENK